MKGVRIAITICTIFLFRVLAKDKNMSFVKKIESIADMEINQINKNKDTNKPPIKMEINKKIDVKNSDNTKHEFSEQQVVCLNQPVTEKDQEGIPENKNGEDDPNSHANKAIES